MSDSFTSLFLYIPGIIIFLVGTGMIKTDRQMKALGARFVANVESCAHVVKKDRMNRDTFNYYNCTVSYFDAAKNRVEKLNVKSPIEYVEGQAVNLFRRSAGQEPVIDDVLQENIFGPWVMAIGGALLLLLALFTNTGKEVQAMLVLGIVMAGAGVSLVRDYLRLKKKNLIPIKAEITDIFERQIAKGTKILRGDKFTYYPIVTYEIDGKKCIRRCNINSGNEKSFKVGETMTLYYDAVNKILQEKTAQLGYMVAGAICVGLGLLVLVTTVAEIISRGGFA